VLLLSQNGAKTVAGFQKAKKAVQKQAQKVVPNQVRHSSFTKFPLQKEIAESRFNPKAL